MKKILLIAGARPNFMKIAPIVRALRKYPALPYKLVHTGQHYDRDMSQTFFDELGIPQPEYNLVVGTDTRKIEEFFEKAIAKKWKKSSIPELWDSKASERIVNKLNGSYR